MRAADRDHLLLSAGQQAGALVVEVAHRRQHLTGPTRRARRAARPARRPTTCRAQRSPSPSGPGRCRGLPAPWRCRARPSARGTCRASRAPSTSTLPRFRRDEAEQRAHQRALAGAVVADHAEHLGWASARGRRRAAPACRHSRRAGSRAFSTGAALMPRARRSRSPPAPDPTGWFWGRPPPAACPGRGRRCGRRCPARCRGCAR